MPLGRLYLRNRWIHDWKDSVDVTIAIPAQSGLALANKAVILLTNVWGKGESCRKCANQHHPSQPRHGVQIQPPHWLNSCVVPSPPYSLPDWRALGYYHYLDTLHQTDSHIQIAAWRPSADSLSVPIFSWIDFAGQIGLHLETKHQRDRVEGNRWCEGSFPTRSFLKASCACWVCFGCLERLVIQLNPRATIMRYTLRNWYSIWKVWWMNWRTPSAINRPAASFTAFSSMKRVTCSSWATESWLDRPEHGLLCSPSRP